MAERAILLHGKPVKLIGPDPELGGVIVEERRWPRGQHTARGTFWRRVSEAELEAAEKERPP
jgi:hypothetical protein